MAGRRRMLAEARLPADAGGLSSSDHAYQRLRRAIVGGHFAQGSRLTEVAVATLLGVSRTPVREAFFRLEADGLLRDGTAGLEIVDPRDEACDIHVLRVAVEGVSARLAAERGSDVELAGIASLAASGAAHGDADAEGQADLNAGFHFAIAAAAHAPRVERLVREYRSYFATPAVMARITGEIARQHAMEHLSIAAAISARDGALAESRMREHLSTCLSAEDLDDG